MTKETIVVQVNRLFDNYNQQATPLMRDAKIALLAPQFNQYHSDALVRAVDTILSDQNITFFPTISQIKAHIRNMISRNTKHLQGCEKCDLSGYYTIWQLREGKYYAFAYRCDCELGQSYQGMPLIDLRAIPKKAHVSFSLLKLMNADKLKDASLNNVGETKIMEKR